MIIMPMPASRGGSAVTLVLTLDAPAVDYTAYYPGTYAACNVVVTGGYVNDCTLEFSDDSGASWGLLAMLDDNGDGNWGGSYDFSGYGAAGEFLLRFKANSTPGGTYFYSNEVTATIESPEVSIYETEPEENFLIDAGGVSFDATVYVPTDSGTVTEAYMDVYLGASLEGSYELTYSQTLNGKDYYGGPAESPSSDGAGSVVGRMTIEGIEIESEARPGTWVVV